MSDSVNQQLPGYAAPDARSALLAAGASGTIYSLVMPESEAALLALVGDRDALLDRYREPWTQKQDAMHEAYFDAWIEWSAPIVRFAAAAFPFRYPTAGASEGIFKLMAEARGERPSIHVFEGEYEGFPAYAEALNIRCVRHDRTAWHAAVGAIDRGGMFWISQPSAIDGLVWPHFDDFALKLAETQPTAQLVPDLTYVGSVARAFRVELTAPIIHAIVFSHSKPFGGYYHRIGGVLARRERPSLFGNRWFKNLLSLAWGTEMMRRHGVHELPRRYRPVQEEAARRCGEALGIELKAADVSLLATAPWRSDMPSLVRTVGRGCTEERVVRLCVTAAMASLIDPTMAPETAPGLLARWDEAK